jgi:hypothetical protein
LYYSFTTSTKTNQKELVVKPEYKEKVRLDEDFVLNIKLSNFKDYSGVEFFITYPKELEFLSIINNKDRTIATWTRNIIRVAILQDWKNKEFSEDFLLGLKFKVKEYPKEEFCCIGFKEIKAVNVCCESKEIASFDINIKVLKETEIKDIKDTTVYPNPLVVSKHGDKLKFMVPKDKEIHLRVYDISGNLVKKEEGIYNGELSLNVEDLSSGIYIYCIEDKQTNTQKIAKFVIIR